MNNVKKGDKVKTILLTILSPYLIFDSIVSVVAAVLLSFTLVHLWASYFSLASSFHSNALLFYLYLVLSAIGAIFFAVGLVLEIRYCKNASKYTQEGRVILSMKKKKGKQKYLIIVIIGIIVYIFSLSSLF